MITDYEQQSFLALAPTVKGEATTATVDRLRYLIACVDCTRPRAIQWDGWMLAQYEPLDYRRPYLKKKPLVPRAFYAIFWLDWLVGVEHYQESARSIQRVQGALAEELARRGWLPKEVAFTPYDTRWPLAAHRLPRILRRE